MTIDDRNLKRRDFLKLAAAGVGLSAIPWFAGIAQAGPRPDAPARRLLVLNFQGGIRSSAAFYASQQTKYNPYGIIEGGSSRFPVGKLLDDHARGEAPLADAAYTLGPAWKGERLPRLREMVRECSILGTWDEGRGDHIRARLEEPTGSPSGDKPGLLTRVAAALSEGRPLDVLPFQLAPYAGFGHAGHLAQFSPVGLAGPRSLPAQSAQSATDLRATGNDWARDDAMRDRLDQRVISKRARNAKALTEVFSAHRRAGRLIGKRLAEPWVNVESYEYQGAAFGTVNAGGGALPLTNAMLGELFSLALGGPLDEPSTHPQYSDAMNAALAMRLLQLGSPAVCLEITGFDTHSQERAEAPGLYRFLGRLWASLFWLMKRIPDPLHEGRSLFDTTLVITMSDFGRDPGAASSGFNGGEGSDHGADPSCYYLAHAAMGAGVVPNRVISEVSTDDYRGDRAAQKLNQRDFLAMLLWSLGLDPRNESWGFDDVGAPLDGLFRT